MEEKELRKILEETAQGFLEEIDTSQRHSATPQELVEIAMSIEPIGEKEKQIWDNMKPELKVEYAYQIADLRKIKEQMLRELEIFDAELTNLYLRMPTFPSKTNLLNLEYHDHRLYRVQLEAFHCLYGGAIAAAEKAVKARAPVRSGGGIGHE